MSYPLYVQHSISWYREYSAELNKDPLLETILTACVYRARWENEPNRNWFAKWEFSFSALECTKFWLNPNQFKQMYSRLRKLERLWFIQRSGTKKANKGLIIYKLLPNDLRQPPRMLENWMINWDNKSANSSVTNKDILKENIDKKNISPEDIALLIAAINKASEKNNLVFLTDDKWGYIDKLLSDQVYNEVLKLLERTLKGKFTRAELIARLYVFAITNKDNKFRRQSLSDFESLYKALPKIVNSVLSFD